MNQCFHYSRDFEATSVRSHFLKTRRCVYPWIFFFLTHPNALTNSVLLRSCRMVRNGPV